MRNRGWLLALALAGCSRAEYRQAADRDAYALTASRIVSPEFDVGRTRVEPDPRSRLADPIDPDKPPRPPDDPAARLFMEHPGGMKGSKRWDKNGVTDRIEYDGWTCSLNLDEKGRLPLTPDRAMDLALLHSREYQNNLESLYLNALDLSLARFQFAPHFSAGEGLSFSHFGSGGAANGESNTLTLNQTAGFTRALAAGGQVVADFANSFVWEFTHGGGPRLVPTSLALSLIQPLLRGFGRDVRLEGLTQAERDLLYAVRSFARFRKQFWADITTEAGYLNLLLQLQSIRNQQADLKSQEQNYRLHLELFEGGKVSRVQVDRAFRGFLAARLSVAQAEAAYQSGLDDYKIRLGLPPRLPVDLDDSRLAQFQLVPQDLEDLREETSKFQLARFSELNNVPPLPKLRDSYGALRALIQRTPSQYERLIKELDEGSKRLDHPPKPGEDPEQLQRTRRDYQRFRETLAEVKKDLDALPARVNRDEAALDETVRKVGWERLLVHTRDFLGHLDDLIAIQTVVRINRIDLPELEEKEEDAIVYAQEHRLDLMNQKAAVTDAWRRVTVTANALRGDLNVNVAANLANDPLRGNPLGISVANSRYTLGFQYNLPLNRVAERNAYRASQIAYERARRDYMALSDRIEQQVRRDLRQLSIQRLSFEISRQNVISAARQVESARNQLLIARDATATSTLDILDALSALLQARNGLAQSYIGYEQLRIQLLLDLERLQLDPRGFPTDEHFNSSPAVAGGPGPGDGAELLPAPRAEPAPVR